jgi:hypothetical protein
MQLSFSGMLGWGEVEDGRRFAPQNEGEVEVEVEVEDEVRWEVSA